MYEFCIGQKILYSLELFVTFRTYEIVFLILCGGFKDMNYFVFIERNMIPIKNKCGIYNKLRNKVYINQIILYLCYQNTSHICKYNSENLVGLVVILNLADLDNYVQHSKLRLLFLIAFLFHFSSATFYYHKVHYYSILFTKQTKTIATLPKKQLLYTRRK